MGCGQVKEECEEGVAGLPLGSRRWSLETPDSLEQDGARRKRMEKRGIYLSICPFNPLPRMRGFGVRVNVPRFLEKTSTGGGGGSYATGVGTREYPRRKTSQGLGPVGSQGDGPEKRGAAQSEVDVNGLRSTVIFYDPVGSPIDFP